MLSGKAIVNLQKLVGSVAVSEYIIQYVSRLVRADAAEGRHRRRSSSSELVDWGAGPRAGQFLIHGGKALAAMDGRFSVAIEDVQKVAIPVLRHRISTNFQAQAEGMTNEDIIERLIRETPPPVIPKYERRRSRVMAIFEILTDGFKKVEETSFSAEGIRERADLQRLLRSNVNVVSPDTLVISEEFGEWQDSRRRIDLLGIDKDANLVVIELKRSEDGGHMELQAIRYAAMVSTMTFERAVEVYSEYLGRIGSDSDPMSSILDFLEWEEADEDSFAPNARIVLVAARFL